jgi:hypothetical protein
MSSRLSKLLVFALVGLFAIAPLALAQQSGRPGAGQTDRPYGTQQPMSPSSPSATSPRTGTMDMQDAIPATVAAVDKQQKTVKLKMQGGETVELKVPERLLSDLSQGDSVQVAIHKAEGASGRGGSMTPSTPSRPETGTQPRPGQTR